MKDGRRADLDTCSTPPGHSLYEGFEVKHLFHSLLNFLPSLSLSQFLCSTWYPVSSLSTHAYRTPVRAGAVKIGRCSDLSARSAVSRPHLYGSEHAGMLMVVG